MENQQLFNQDSFPELNFPTFEFRFKRDGDKLMILDPFRKKYIVLTSEEWVRQHLAQFLVRDYHYPAGLLVTEASISLKGKSLRSDILIYNSKGEPLLLAECKAPQVSITQSVFDQAANYNYQYKVEYLIVSNGLEHYCCFVNWREKKLDFLLQIPDYSSIK